MWFEGGDFRSFRITGKDAGDFLHRQLSNEIRHLREGQGASTCYLSPQGKVNLYFTLWKEEEGYRATLWGDQGNRFHEQLDRYLFREEVTVADLRQAESAFVLAGEEALEGLLGESLPFPLKDSPEKRVLIPRDGVTLRVESYNWLTLPCFLIWTPRNKADILLQDLQNRFASASDWTTFHDHRIPMGTPWPEFEVTEELIPYECGLADAVSLTKGCYVGQEVIARMHNLGKPPRELRGLWIEGETPVPRGTPVWVGGIQVGEVLSSGADPSTRQTIATSSIRRKFLAAGTEVRVGDFPGKVFPFPLEKNHELS
jgi:folate-binding protein YgfZ